MRGGIVVTSASIRIIAVSVLLAALPVLAASASAADDEPYLVEYRAYNAALESGDREAAATHGLAAWQAAEESLGNHRLTGILAYNYGRLMTFSASDEAAASLRRARELADLGVADLPEPALQLYLGYAEFATSRFKRKPANRLREALDAVGMADETLIRDVAPMWLKLALHDVDTRQYRKAIESAANAETAIRKAYPDASRGLVEAILFGAIARIAPSPRTIENLEAATDQFDRARRLFPPQEDLDTFDPLLAQVLAWHHVTWEALQALYVKKGREQADSEDDESSPAPPLFQRNESLECGDFEWEERQPPRYPAGALHDGYFGAVMLGYRLGDDLKPHDARILAEVPSGERFGKVSLAALSEWRLKAVPTGAPACYRNLVTFIKFIIEP